MRNGLLSSDEGSAALDQHWHGWCSVCKARSQAPYYGNPEELGIECPKCQTGLLEFPELHPAHWAASGFDMEGWAANIGA